jgi:hypothetical protein
VTCWPLQLPVQVGASHVWHISQWPAGGAEKRPKLFRLFLWKKCAACPCGVVAGNSILMDRQQGHAEPASIVVQRRRERLGWPADDWAVRGWCWAHFSRLIDCRCLLI